MNVEKLGVGVMIGMLSGNSETVDAVRLSLGKTIKTVELNDNALRFAFTDDSKLIIWDDGQSCCESRYMVTADKLEDYADAQLLDLEIKTAPEIACQYGDHEIQFLDVKTSKGVFQMANHNEHNGYYGGFWLKASTK